MKTTLAVLLLALAMPLVAEVDPRIMEGIKLHDAGKYDEAIAKYKEVLAGDPGNLLAIYELAFAQQAKGDYAACRATLEPFADRPGREQSPILGLLGNCIDQGGDSKRAIEVYRKGLKVNPNDTQILYNFAVTLSNQGHYAEARELLKKELVLRPGHPGGHYLLGKVFQAEGFRGPAILEFLRLLAIETGTERTADAAQRLISLLNLGVEKKGEKQIDVQIDSKSRTEEGDFKAWEMMLAILSSGRFLTDEAMQQIETSEFERVRMQVASSIRSLLEAPPEGRHYSVEHNVPFFARMEEKKLLDTFAGLAITSLRLPGGDEWAKKNEAAIREYAAFVQGLPR